MPNTIENGNRVPFFPTDYSENATKLGGAERHITKIGFQGEKDTHILKEPQERNYIDLLAERFPPTNESERKAVEELSAYFDSRENFVSSKKDYDKMKEIFGDLIADTTFIVGDPREGNRTGFYVIQKNVNGKTWSDFSKQETQERKDLWRADHRGDLLKLMGGARKAFIELGSPVDIWGDNIMIDMEDNVVMVDPGSPSLINDKFELIVKLSPEMRSFIANRILDRVSEQDRWVSTFGFTEQQYEEAVQGIRNKCAQLLEPDDQS